MRKSKYENIVTMYEQGMTVEQIAVQFKVDQSVMYRNLKRRDCRFRPQIRKGKDNPFYRGGSIQYPDIKLAVKKARKKGYLMPSDCENCGSTKQIEGHHSDYNRYLDVQWLCRKCHFNWHRLFVAIPRREIA